ncbi:MAG: hypothetical protein RLZZ515_913 [Cyanobacteriota bacterium]|jgi:hypothetical protein
MRWGWLCALLPGLLAPAQAQLPAMPPLPSLPEPIDPELQTCVTRFGHTGCAARLYAQLLCRSVGDPAISEQMQLQLAEQYEQAAIDFRGITPEQVETAAVRYYSPMLCPDKSPQIRQLFNPS